MTAPDKNGIPIQVGDTIRRAEGTLHPVINILSNNTLLIVVTIESVVNSGAYNNLATMSIYSDITELFIEDPTKFISRLPV